MDIISNGGRCGVEMVVVDSRTNKNLGTTIYNDDKVVVFGAGYCDTTLFNDILTILI